MRERQTGPPAFALHGAKVADPAALPWIVAAVDGRGARLTHLADGGSAGLFSFMPLREPTADGR